MSYQSMIRSMHAAERRQQREAQRHLREVERQANEQAKLSASEQARLEVDTYEKQVEALLSVHREQGEIWDWIAVVASLPPPCPGNLCRNEHRARQRATVLTEPEREAFQVLMEKARAEDDEEFRKASQKYSQDKAEWEKLKRLAERILARDHKALTEALIELSPFAEISDLGSEIQFTVHTIELVECVLKVNGTEVIPTTVRTLTSSGKVSLKSMPKARYQEIYQDYVSGCVLRVAREIFALIPVDTVLVTSTVDSTDSRTGQTVEQPVLSVVMPRTVVAQLDFAQLDPSEALANFEHRGDFKKHRKSESFEPITPITPGELAYGGPDKMAFDQLLVHVQKLRVEIGAEIRRVRETTNLKTA